MRVIEGVGELRRLVGEELGVGDWERVDQARIDAFAAVTGDHQWIHVDSARAARGPYGTTIAHGHLTTSLLPLLLRSAYRVDGLSASVNYGSDRVRLTAPVPAGSRIRAAAVLEELRDTPAGVLARIGATVEREGATRPVLVAQALTLLIEPASTGAVGPS